MKKQTLSFGVIAPAVVILWILLRTGTAGAETLRLHDPAGGAGWVALTGSQGLTLRACQDEACASGPETSVAWPAGISHPEERAQLRAISLLEGKEVLHLVLQGVPVPSHVEGEPPTAASFEVLAALVKPGTRPSVLFQGLTGWTEGQEGERRGPRILVRDLGRGGTLLAVGTEQENVQLCGRQVLLAPKLLIPETMQLRPAKLQPLTPLERARAITLQASPVEHSPGPRLLHAVLASSAVGSPQALTDGDLATTWAESRSGSGLGEFVILRAPSDLPLTGFEFVLAPLGTGTATTTPDEGNRASPQRLWLATDDSLLQVQFPSNAEDAPSRTFRVELPQALKTGCVALVLDQASRNHPDAEVGLAEVSARTAFDLEQLDEVLAALSSGGERAKTAAAALEVGGESAARALLEAFPQLSPAAQKLAADVIERAGCAYSAALHARALLGDGAIAPVQSQQHLTLCGLASVEPLLSVLPQASGQGLASIAGQLSLISTSEDSPPETTHQILVDLAAQLKRSSPSERRSIRDALFQASGHARCQASLRAILRESGSPSQKLELLRALGSRLVSFLPEAAEAFESARGNATFESQFLLLPVAAQLAAVDLHARRFLQAAFRSDNPHLRGQASAVAPQALFATELLEMLRDDQMRVRVSAMRRLSGQHKFAADALSERLLRDPWPLARSTAAERLSELPRSGEAAIQIDKDLEQVLQHDTSPHVRRSVALALGARGARLAAQALRELLENEAEDQEVRAAAAQALGKLCDEPALDRLTSFAVTLAYPTATPAQRVIGRAALGALLRIGPSDLKERLKPFESPEAPKASWQLLENGEAQKRCPATR